MFSQLSCIFWSVFFRARGAVGGGLFVLGPQMKNLSKGRKENIYSAQYAAAYLIISSMCNLADVIKTVKL